MAGARQNSSQESIINLSKKLDKMIDSAYEDSQETIKLLESINVVQKQEISSELKKQTGSLERLNLSFVQWQEKQYDMLVKIEKKSGSSVIDSNIILPDSGKLKEFFDVMFTAGTKAFVGLFGALSLIGKYGPKVVEGAVLVSESMKVMLKTAVGLDMKDALKSVVALGLLVKTDMGSLIKVLMNLSIGGLLFDDRIYKTALEVASAVRVLLSTAKGLDKTTILGSIGAFSLISASKLTDLITVLKSSFSFTGWIKGTNLRRTATEVSAAMKILLQAGEGISKTQAVASVAAYALIAGSKLESLIKVLTSSFGLFTGIKMRKRARQVREATAILLGGTTPFWNKLHGIDDSKFTKENAVKAIFVYGLIGKGIGEFLKSLMQSFGFLGLGGTGKIVIRAIRLRKAAMILASIPENITMKTVVKAAAIYLVLGLGIKLLVRPILWAGILAPLVWIGTRVIAGAVKRLLGAMEVVTASGKQLAGASIFLLSIGAFIGGLMFMAIVALGLSPVIIPGMLVIKLMVNIFVKINQQLADAGMDQDAITRLGVVMTMVGAILTIAGIIINFSRTQPFSAILKNVILFVTISLILSGLTYLITKILAKAGKEGMDLYGLMTTSLTSLVNALQVILISKFGEKSAASIKTVLIFSISSLIVAGTTFLIMKMLGKSKSDMTYSTILKMGLILGVITLITFAVIKASEGISAGTILNVGLFMLVGILIAFAAKKITGMLNKNIGDVIKGISALIIFTIGMLAIAFGIKKFGELVSIGDAIFAFLVVGAFAFMAHKLGKSATDNLQGAAVIAVIGFAIIIFSYGLGMFKASGFGIVDALVLGLTVGVLGLIAYFMGKSFKEVALGALALVFIGVSLFVITYALDYFKSIKLGWEDIVMLGATIAMLGIEMYLIGKKWSVIAKGAAVVAGFGAALWVVGKGMKSWMKSEVSWKQVGILGATIAMLGVEFYLVGKRAVDVGKGALAIAALGAALAVVGFGMKQWMKAKATMTQVKTLGKTILMLGVQFGIAGAGPLPVAIGLGALAIAGLGAALAVVGFGMKQWMKAKATMSQVKILGKTILMLGVQFGAAGVGSVLIGLGAVAMAAAAGVLYLISKSMSIWAKANITYKTIKIMKAAISNLGMVLKSMGWSSIEIGAGAAAMYVAGKSLKFITGSIKHYMKANIKYKDVKDLKKSIVTLISAITLVGDKAALKKHNIDINALSRAVSGFKKMNTVFNTMVHFIKVWNKLKAPGKTANSIKWSMLIIFSSAVRIIEKWDKLKNPMRVIYSLKSFMSGMISVFDPTKNKSIQNSSRYMSTFAFNIEKMAKSADPLTKLAKNMDSIQKSMKLFKDHLNGLDLKKLTLTDSMMKSIAALSKNPEAVAGIISKSINKSYEELIKALKELATTVKEPKEEKGILERAGDAIKAGANSLFGNEPTKVEKKPVIPEKNYENTNVQGAQKVYIVNAPAGWR